MKSEHMIVSLVGLLLLLSMPGYADSQSSNTLDTKALAYETVLEPISRHFHSPYYLSLLQIFPNSTVPLMELVSKQDNPFLEETTCPE
jgi:hypothetical protein